MIGGKADVGALALQDVGEPMGKLDIAIAGALGLAQRLEEGLIADPVKLACDRFKADIGHCFPPLCPFVSPFARASVSCARPDETVHRTGRARASSNPTPSRSSSRAV